MLGRGIICLSLSFAVLLSVSCTQMPEWAPPGEGNIAFEKLPEKDSIPLKWGKLVSTNIDPNASYLCHLWFQDENGSLRMADYDYRTNKLSLNARLITRK